MTESQTASRSRTRRRVIAALVVVAFGLSAFLLPVLLLGNRVAQSRLESSLPSACKAPIGSGRTNVIQPQGGVPGVIGHFRGTVTEAQATRFVAGPFLPQDIFVGCSHHVAFYSSDWANRRFIVYFANGDNGDDRNAVAEALTRTGMFDSVRVL